MKLTSLCYIEKDHQFLMLHRNKKKDDNNHGKWIGIGGKFELNETPEECMIREVKEETNLDILTYRYCGVITFISNQDESEYMHLFHARSFIGEVKSSDEGTLEWINIDDLHRLKLWEGDHIFLDLLINEYPFFSLKLTYENQHIVEVELDHKIIDF